MARRKIRLSLRASRPTDEPTLSALLKLCFRPAERPTPFGLRSLLEEGGSFLIHGDGRAYAMAVFRTRPDCEIVTVAVHPGCRRRGFGQRLLRRALLRIGELKPGEPTSIRVESTNRPGLALCQEVGFEVRDSLGDYFGEGRDALQLHYDPATAHDPE